MRLENKGNGDEYFIDLFEKWWHYPLLAFTWFLPHKAYPYKEKDGSVPAKFKFDAKMGLATGLSLIQVPGGTPAKKVGEKMPMPA